MHHADGAPALNAQETSTSGKTLLHLLKVAASSAEAEIAAGCHAAKRHTFTRNVLNFLLAVVDKSITGATPHFIDNTAAVTLSQNDGVSKKTEHFLRWMLYLREMVLNGWIRTIFVGTKDMMADGLTKVIDKTRFTRMKNFLMGR